MPYADMVRREAIRRTDGGWDCGRDFPRGECGVLGVCCRPYVTGDRYTVRIALWAWVSEDGVAYGRGFNGWPHGPGLDAPARRAAA